MFMMTASVFCRRVTSSKLTGLTITSSKGIQYCENVRYSWSYSKRLLAKPVYAVNFTKYHTNNINKFGIFSRCKQTSPDHGKGSENVSSNVEEPPEKLSLFKRYHKMLKEYWYVLLPVHFVTSAFWFGGFYYAAKCGIDIVPFLEYINVPEKFIKPLKNSSLGYIAVASAFYKLATPGRYMVTLGGTTIAVKILTKRGLIRPAPTKAELKTIIQNKLKKDTSGKQP